MAKKIRQVAIVVLGMHRSGTSALTKVLNLVGCGLPQTLMPPGVGNQHGHWESDALYNFNDAIFEEAGSNWPDWRAINPGWYSSPAYPRAVRRGAEILAEEFGDASLFVVKDPRICKLMPLWAEIFKKRKVTTRFVLPIRAPEEVAGSLATRDGTDQLYGGLLWLRHVLEAERHTRGRKRVFTSFDQLISDWQALADRVGASLGLSWPRRSPLVDEEVKRFLDPDSRHHGDGRSRVAETQPQWIGDVAAILLRWAEKGESANDYPKLDRAFASLEDAADKLGGIVFRATSAIDRLPQLEAQIAAQAELRQRIDELSAENASLREDADEASRFAVERAELDQRIAELDQDRNSLRGQIEQIVALRAEAAMLPLQNRLAELESELARHREDAAIAARTRDETQAENAALAYRLGEAEHALASAQDAYAATAAARDELESHLLQRREEAAQAWRELDEARQALEGAQHDHTAMALRLSEAENAHTTAEAARHAQTLLRQEMEEILARKQGEAAQAWQELESAQLDSADLSQRLREMELAAAKRARIAETKHHVERAAYERRLAVQGDEIASLTRSLNLEQQKHERKMQQADLLRLINAATLGHMWWWSLLPQSWRQRKLSKWLMSKGLFDADAYLARHPDIAAAGTDPLEHYLCHGIIEGRTF